MNTAVASQTEKKPRTVKKVSISDKAQSWCRRVAGIALRRAFRVKAYKNDFDRLESKGGVSSLNFYLLPKIYHRKRISHTDGDGDIYLHPEFFDDKGNLRKKLGKVARDELKAAIFKEVAHHAVKRTNTEFYKIMVRCPWTGARVEGAKGNKREARSFLTSRKTQKDSKRRKMQEVPTGLKETVKMFDLHEGKHVEVVADIFLADGKIKIARATHNGRNLRTMLPGAAELRSRLGL